MAKFILIGILMLMCQLAMAITSTVELFEANYKYTTPQNVLESCFKDYHDIKLKFDDLIHKKKLDPRFYNLSYKIDENEKRGKCLIVGSSPLAIKLELKETPKLRFDKKEAQEKCMSYEKEILQRNPNTIYSLLHLEDTMISRKMSCRVKYIKVTI